MVLIKRLGRRVWDGLKRVARFWGLLLLLTVLPFVLATEGPPPGLLDTQVHRLLYRERFDFVDWELSAVVGKLTHGLIAPQRYMDEAARRDFVLDYLDLVQRIHQLEGEIYLIYTDPDVADAYVETAEQRARLTEMRRQQRYRQQLAEAILEEQVACVLLEEGFGWMGQMFPPVRAHFTPLPRLLIISPRAHIERMYSLFLRHGLEVAEQEMIEAQVESSNDIPLSTRVNSPQATVGDVSSLVTGIGGLSAYPAMLLESSNLNWIADVIAHEWTHHYLTPRPLGWYYGENPETRTINETVASIVGEEAGRAVVARYYPAFLPPEPPIDQVEEEVVEADPPEPPPFDFRAEMYETRVRVDELLEAGRVEEAEAYMEARRRMFVEQGYHIRKLNQAYFAFHGSYAAHPGAAGDDPIGPTVRRLHELSPDLHTFVERVAPVTTLSELEAVLLGIEDAAIR